MRALRYEVDFDVASPARPQTGKLRVAMPADAVVLRGREVQWPVTVSGDFPLGKTTGKIQVRAAGLTAPVAVTFEVNARRCPCWIAACAALGLFFGWAVRVQLQGKRDRALARQAASRVLQDYLTASAEGPDAQFRHDLQAPENALRSATQTGDAAAIQTEVTTARAALVAAQTALATRRQWLADLLVPLRGTLQQSWNLPPTAAAALEAARQLTETIAAAADAQDIGKAQHSFDTELPPVLTALAEAAGTWRASTGRYLQAIADNPPALPDHGVEHIGESIKTWRASYSDHHARTSVTQVDLTKELGDTHAALAAAHDIIRDLQVRGQEIAGWLHREFAPLAPAAPFDAIVAVARQDGAAAEQGLADPETARTAPAQRQAAEVAAWMDAFRAVTNAGTNLADVQAALNAGQWSTAGTTALKLITTPAGAGVALGGAVAASAVTPAIAPPTSRLTSLHVAAVEGSATARPLRGTRVLTGSPEEQMALERVGKAAAAAQSAVLFVIFVVAAYALYLPLWVGTLPEMFGLFAWAFALDPHDGLDSADPQEVSSCGTLTSQVALLWWVSHGLLPQQHRREPLAAIGGGADGFDAEGDDAGAAEIDAQRERFVGQGERRGAEKRVAVAVDREGGAEVGRGIFRDGDAGREDGETGWHSVGDREIRSDGDDVGRVGAAFLHLQSRGGVDARTRLDFEGFLLRERLVAAGAGAQANR